MSPIEGATIHTVTEGSPADMAGFSSGCILHSVNGKPLRDIIDWRWLSDDDAISLCYTDTAGDSGTVVLERAEGEQWGFEFEGQVFDGIKTCKNTCTFCFMRQLPKGMRPSLYLRDDDFRLSFLAGTFVTLTNATPEDEARIIEQRISPLRLSLHAVSPAIRAQLIGSCEAKGIEACERLLDAGIEMHAQIVLVPGVNDGEELRETLAWAYERKGIVGAGVVPLGFTKHQDSFERSFNDADSAQAVLNDIEALQKRALAERGTPWVFAADEFYRNAYAEKLLEFLPPSAHYGDFAMFEDGIGIIRSTVDAWNESAPLAEQLAEALSSHAMRIHMVVGYAQQEFTPALIDASPLRDLLVPLPVRNEFFGGNVDVTGLLCGCDIVAAVNALPAAAGKETDLVVLPRVIFNDDGVTLDDMNLEDMQSMTDTALAVVSCSPSDYLAEMIGITAEYRGTNHAPTFSRRRRSPECR